MSIRDCPICNRDGYFRGKPCRNCNGNGHISSDPSVNAPYASQEQMNRASTYPKEAPKMTALCRNCGKIWAIHGAHDGHCPVEDTTYGMVRESDTFWTAPNSLKD